MTKYVFVGNRTNAIHAHIDKLFAKTNETVEQRNENANSLIESYFQQFGDVPASSALERLGSYIMREDYEDKRPDKISKTEYPVMSEQQEQRRMRREPTSSGIDLFTADNSAGKRSGTQIDVKSGEAVPTKTPIHPSTVPNTSKAYAY